MINQEINAKDRMIMTVKRKRRIIIPMTTMMETMTLMMDREINQNPKDEENEMNQRLRPKIIRSFSVSISKQMKTVRMQSVTPNHFVLIWRNSLIQEKRKMSLRLRRERKGMDSRLILESSSPPQCILLIISILLMTSLRRDSFKKPSKKGLIWKKIHMFIFGRQDMKRLTPRNGKRERIEMM